MEVESENKPMINNKYSIIERKGKGAFAKVYLCEDTTNQKRYAIKVLNQKTESFEKEMNMLQKVSKLNCPYLVNLVEYGEGPVKLENKDETTNQYAVLEYACKGEIFDYIFCAQKGLEEKYAKVVFAKILNGVKSIHDAGICHLDLKMQNILVDENFNPKICDFGFAEDTTNGKLEKFVGTPNYAAPEIFLHRPFKGDKADIFSLGVILLNLTTCKIGFVQATRRDKYYRLIMTKKYKDYWNAVKSQVGELSEELKNLYIKMINFNPDERPSVSEILDDPWMKEVKDLNQDQFHALENEVLKDFQNREKLVIENNASLSTDESDSQMSFENNRGISDEEREYFSLDLLPKLIMKTGLNMNNFIKINGNLEPAKFMNLLANKIKQDYEDKCDIEEAKKTLKFNVIFKNEQEEEEEEENKELEEELNKLGLENIDNFDDGIKIKNSVIQIKLFESANGGYVVRFLKKDGEIEEYHKNLQGIIEIIKGLI